MLEAELGTVKAIRASLTARNIPLLDVPAQIGGRAVPEYRLVRPGGTVKLEEGWEHPSAPEALSQRRWP